MTRVCVVKQHTTYDLFTRASTDLREVVESSNWRSGPLGLWEAFQTDARIVMEDPARECQLGKQHWSQYVQGWMIWPEGSTAEVANAVNWSGYDIVIAVDVAVPTRIVMRHPGVMWCYYFIEGGPWGIDGQYRGSPFFGYNVFLNHRLSKSLLTPASGAARQMRSTRRSVLDFPYYMQSAQSVRALYPELVTGQRQGFCLSHHSRCMFAEDELAALAGFGPVRTQWSTIADIHKAEVLSRYFIVHPGSKPTAGTALIEAISAGCLVLAPKDRILGFPELLAPELEFSTVQGLVALVRALEHDHARLEHLRVQQENKIQAWCFENPKRNLETLLQAFRSSSVSSGRQRRAEIRSHAVAACQLAALRAARRAGRALGRSPVAG
jgi:hypothetical protein